MRALLAGMCLLLASDALADVVSDGRAIYEQTCIACHGPDGKGAIPGIEQLTEKGALAKSDETLFNSIRDGSHSSGAVISMPAKGGNPSLSDDDIEAVLTFIRQRFGSQ